MTEPVFVIRPDDGPIGPKHVALNVLLMVINRCVCLKIDILLYEIWNTSGQIKVKKIIIFDCLYRRTRDKPLAVLL
jgi:hypothetical protein